MRHTLFVLACAAAAALPCLAQEEPAESLAPLRVDASFGVDGEIRGAGRGPTRMQGFTHVAVDSRGRVVAAGFGRRTRRARQLVTSTSLVARFLPDGSPDRRFGARGVVRLPRPGIVTDIVLDGDGRITLVGDFPGGRNTNFGALRLTAKGTLDRSFGRGGLVHATPGTGSTWTHVQRLSADGGLAAASQVGSSQLVVVRLDAAGEYVPDFGVAGVAPAGTERIHDIAVDAESRIVVSTTTGVFRLRADGRRDTSFGSAGSLAGADGAPVVAAPGTLALDADGRIALRDVPGESGGQRLYRYLADGAPDPAFSDDGRAGLPSTRQRIAPHTTTRYASGGGRFVEVAPVGYRYDVPIGVDVDAEFIVESIDASAPGALAVLALAEPEIPRIKRATTEVRAVAVAADGSAAFVAGWLYLRHTSERRTWTPRLVRVDLTPDAPRSLPRLSLRLLGQPFVQVRTEEVPHASLAGAVGVTNTGELASGPADVRVYFSDDDAFDPAADTFYRSERIDELPPGDTYFAGPFGLLPGGAASVRGRRVILVVQRRDGPLASGEPDDVVVSGAVE